MWECYDPDSLEYAGPIPPEHHNSSFVERAVEIAMERVKNPLYKNWSFRELSEGEFRKFRFAVHTFLDHETFAKECTELLRKKMKTIGDARN